MGFINNGNTCDKSRCRVHKNIVSRTRRKGCNLWKAQYYETRPFFYNLMQLVNILFYLNVVTKALSLTLYLSLKLLDILHVISVSFSCTKCVRNIWIIHLNKVLSKHLYYLLYTTSYKHLHYYFVEGRFATLVSLFCTRSVRNIFRFDKCLANYCQETVKKHWTVLCNLFYWNWNDLSICLKAQVSNSMRICSVFRSVACGRRNKPRRHFFIFLL